MNTQKCEYCLPLALVVAAIFGIVIGLLFINAYIPNIVLATWIVFGIAGAILLILIGVALVAALTDNAALKRCLCVYGTPLLIATLGTLIVATMALSITLIVAVPIAVLIGIMAAFFAAMVMLLICLFRCIFAGFCNHHC